MKNKDLIISLIHQDLKHNQLISGLENLGLDGEEVHCLSVLEIVFKLMKIPEGEISDKWGELYSNFIEEAQNYSITSKGETLIPLAESCYLQLKDLVG